MDFIDTSKYLPGLQGDLIHAVRIPSDKLVSALERIGFTVFIINGSVISDKATFFEETANVFEFPSYFGKNWDAFIECISDFFISLNQSNTAIVWKDVETLLSTDLQTFTDAICILYEQIITMHLQRTYQGENQKETNQVEVFLIGNDKRFPVIKTK